MLGDLTVGRGLVLSAEAEQGGHENPSGQRDANRYSRHAHSSPKRPWNSMMLRGEVRPRHPANLRTDPDGANRICTWRLTASRGHLKDPSTPIPRIREAAQQELRNVVMALGGVAVELAEVA
jgi:hypothetical protein